MVCSVLVIAGSTDVQLGVGITVVVVVQEYLDCDAVADTATVCDVVCGKSWEVLQATRWEIAILYVQTSCGVHEVVKGVPSMGSFWLSAKSGCAQWT